MNRFTLAQAYTYIHTYMHTCIPTNFLSWSCIEFQCCPIKNALSANKEKNSLCHHSPELQCVVILNHPFDLVVSLSRLPVTRVTRQNLESMLHTCVPDTKSHVCSAQVEIIIQQLSQASGCVAYSKEFGTRLKLT